MKADSDTIIRKLKIAEGQINGIIKMVNDDKYCIDISNQILATQTLLKNVNQEILSAHIRGCVKEALNTDEDNPKIEEALKLLEKMNK